MRRVYIETYGCQMNVSDSELMAGILAGRGYLMVDSEDEADVVLLNTCAVREKAEERIFGRLGWLKSAKEQRPGLVVGIAGCMAEHLQEKIVKRAPYVDVLVGPDAYRRLPELIEGAAPSADPMVDLRLDRQELYEDVVPQRQDGVSGWIAVMRGCDKFCTFCVVPFTRGRERSLPAESIVKQALAMEKKGFREVTLLGQTVSSYREGATDFAGLLRAVHDQTSMRIRFTSPYPTDFDDALLQTLGELPRVGHHLHLPVQSGSSSVLERMRRQYSAEHYLALIERIRERLPHFALTTDFIVGFPGETEEEFAQTLELSQQVGFDSAFMFSYSERSGTRAAKSQADDVPEAVKAERLQRLIKLQEQQSRRRSAERIASMVEVLVDGENPKQPGQAMGRASCFKTTVLLGGSFAPGELVSARVESASTHTLYAQPLAAKS